MKVPNVRYCYNMQLCPRIQNVPKISENFAKYTTSQGFRPSPPALSWCSSATVVEGDADRNELRSGALPVKGQREGVLLLPTCVKDQLISASTTHNVLSRRRRVISPGRRTRRGVRMMYEILKGKMPMVG